MGHWHPSSGQRGKQNMIRIEDIAVQPSGYQMFTDGWFRFPLLQWNDALPTVRVLAISFVRTGLLLTASSRRA